VWCVARDVRCACRAGGERRQPSADNCIAGLALLPMAPHRTHGRAAAGPRESAKPHRSRIVSSSSKSPTPLFPSSQESKITGPYGRSNSSTLVCRFALACGRDAWPTGISPTLAHPHRPEAGQGIQDRINHAPGKAKDPARQLRHFSEHAVGVSLVQDRHLRAGKPDLPCSRET
jgi:hypothetical protein